MFWPAVGGVLPIAMAIAISPLATVTVILLLLSDRGRAKGLLLLVGWLAAVLGVVALAYLFTGTVADSGTDTAPGVDLLQLLLGLAFWGLAVREWRSRPRPGQRAPEPKILARVNTLSPPAALGVGLAEALLSVKTVPLAVGAGAQLGQSGVAGSAAAVALVVFSLVASINIIVPVVAVLAGGDRVRAPLMAAKQWLIDNVTAILLVMFVLIGANLVGKGLGLLA